MSERGWKRVTATKAADVCRKYAVAPEASQVLTPESAPRPFFQALTDRGLYPESVRFLAHALPKREALWWACQCVRTAGAASQPVEAAALTATERYVVTPTDDNRRAAMAAAEAAGLATPAGATGAAAFFSAGSLAPSNLAPVPPADHLTALTVSNAIVLSAVLREPQNAATRYKSFLDLGQAIAEGSNRWPEAKS